MTDTKLWRRGLALILALMTVCSLALEGAALSVSPEEPDPVAEQAEAIEPSAEEGTDSLEETPTENLPEPSEPESTEGTEEELPEGEPEEPVEETLDTEPELPPEEKQETEPELPAGETQAAEPDVPETDPSETEPEEPVYQLHVASTQTLSLEYDDRYSFSSMAEGVVILKIETDQVTSYQVSRGSKTAQRDTDVLVPDGDSDTDVVASGVGTATVLLVSEDQLDVGLAALNGETDPDGNTVQTGSVPAAAQTDGTAQAPVEEMDSVPVDGTEPVQVDVIEVQVTVKPAKLTMMFLAGQSNMEGLCSLREPNRMVDSVACPVGEVYSTYSPSNGGVGWYTAKIPKDTYTTNANELVAGSLTGTTNRNGGTLAYPLNALTTQGNGKTGMDGALAYEWNRLTGDKVWTVNAAWSGSSITGWVRGGSCYTKALNVFQAAIKTMQAEVSAGHYTEGNRLFFWLQGEANKGMSAENYLADFQSMQNGMVSGCGIQYIGLIVPRSCQGSAINAEDISMTGPRIAQYYMANSTSTQFGKVYVVSNVNEQWVSDAGVRDYFQFAYPSGHLTYPLRSSTHLSGLPTTVEEVHADNHYYQVGHNENGLTAARNMYYIVKNQRPSSSVSVSWRDSRGQDLGNAITLETNDSTTIIPVVTPVYNSKKVTIQSSTTYMTYNQKTGLLKTTRAGTASLQARDGSGKLQKVLTVRVEAFPTPALGNIANQAGGVRITWSRSAGASGYYVYRKMPGQSWSKIAAVTGNSYTDSKVSSGTTYIYTVRAYQGRTLSNYDPNGLSITYVAPTQIKVSGVVGKVQVTWTKVSTADSYKVYRRVKGGGWKALAVVDRNSLSYTDTTAANGTLYEYAVVSRRSGSQSAYTPVSWLGLDTPQLVSVQNVENGIRVSWKKVAQATGYLLYRRLPGTQWARIAQLNSGATCYYVDSSVRNGTTYEYTLKATYGSITSDYDRQGGRTLCLATPVVTAMQNKVNGIALKWNQVAGATGYQVYRKTGSGSWVRLGNVSGTSYTDINNLQSGTTYIYTVRACMGSTQSGYKSAGYSLLCLETPGIRTLTNTAAGIQVTWNKVTGATSYLVYRKNGSSSWLRLGQVSGTSYTDTTAPNGTASIYTIRAVRGTVLSDYDHTGSQVYRLTAPVLTGAAATTGGIRVQWKAVSGAESYLVYRKSGTSGWVRIAQVGNTNYLDQTVASGANYTYTVRAVRQGILSDYNRSGVSAKAR